MAANKENPDRSFLFLCSCRRTRVNTESESSVFLFFVAFSMNVARDV